MALYHELLHYVHRMDDCRQEVLADEGAFAELARLLIAREVKRVYILSGKQTRKLKLYDAFVETLTLAGVRCFIYSEVDKFPDARTVERCAAQCQTYNCEVVVAFGGGTVIDIAKMVSVWVTNPNKSLYQLRGINKIPNPGVDLYAVATTGSGAESSACSIIQYDQQLCFFFSEHLVPKTVVLDPNLVLRLPTDSFLSASMIALTHAIEAYTSSFSPEFPADRANVMVAVPIFFSYLEKCYKHSVTNDKYLQMMMAPYYAGVASRRIGFGPAHCLAMRISEKYGIPLGRACAAVLPPFLELEFDNIVKPLAELARASHLCSAKATEPEAARAFIDGLRSLMRRVNIPETITCLKAEDYNGIIEMVLLDAKNWGVPVKLTSRMLLTILRSLK
ncbi:MAG: iron-containing alcohol dehydrogenase [Clostridiales bacterium]|nr:iron-containing alcohol dehydrogenase [Clostridiales bacterium]